MYQIYIADVSPLASASCFQQELLSADAHRRARIMQMQKQEARRLSLAAGRLQQLALSYWPKEPAYTNLTHSGHLAAAAISDRPVGVDIQQQISANWQKLACRWFTREEQDWLKPEKDGGAARFLRLWTLKESLLKATGIGLSLGLNSFSVIPGEDITEAPHFCWRKETAFSHLPYQFREWCFMDVPGAVCVQQETPLSPAELQICTFPLPITKIPK